MIVTKSFLHQLISLWAPTRSWLSQHVKRLTTSLFPVYAPVWHQQLHRAQYRLQMLGLLAICSEKDNVVFVDSSPSFMLSDGSINDGYLLTDGFFVFEMVYFRSYWSHLDISTTICPHQNTAVGFQLMTVGFFKFGPLLTEPSVRTSMRWRTIHHKEVYVI